MLLPVASRRDALRQLVQRYRRFDRSIPVNIRALLPLIDKLNQEVAFTITDLNYTALKAPRPSRRVSKTKRLAVWKIRHNLGGTGTGTGTKWLAVVRSLRTKAFSHRFQDTSSSEKNATSITAQ
jgi:hypothetical protein